MRLSPLLSALVLSSALTAGALTTPVSAAPAPSPAVAAGPSASPKVTIKSWVPTVVYGEKKVVKGVLKGRGKARKMVMLQRKLPGGAWTTLSKTRSKGSGKYVLKVPTHFYTSKLSYRVAVKKGKATKPRAITVRAPHAPVGPEGAWARLDTSTKFQYNPCKPITYRVNLNGMDESAMADLKLAVKLVEQASGLRYKYLGTTDKLGFDRVKGNHPKDTNLLVGWASEGEIEYSFSQASGYGGVEEAVWAKSPKFGQVAMSTKTSVVLDKHATYIYPGSTPSSNTESWPRVQLLQHELAHASGLGHRLDMPGQLMSYELWDKWGAGDLTGLSKVGLASGCLKPLAAGPTAAPVDFPTVALP